MAQATVTISDFALTETWASGGSPQGVEKTVKFDFTLPEGSQVSNCTQQFYAGSPQYGGDADVQYRKSDQDIDEQDIDKMNDNTFQFTPSASARSVSVTFKFTCNGNSVGGTSSLAIKNIKQLVTYSLPVTDFTLSHTTADIGTSIKGTITSGDLSLTRHYFYQLGNYKSTTQGVTLSLNNFDIAQEEDALTGMVDSHTGIATVTLQTQSGGVIVHEVSKSLTVTCPNAYAPSIGTATVEGANLVELRAEDTPEDEEGEMIYVQGISSATVTVEGLSTKHHASIKSVTVSVGTEYGDAQAEDGSYKYTTGVFSEAGELDITITVTDSRGLSTSEVVQIKVVAHEKPSFSSLRILRCNVDGTLNPEGVYIGILADFTYDKTTGDKITPTVQYAAVGTEDYSPEKGYGALYCEKLESGVFQPIKFNMGTVENPNITPIQFGTQNSRDIKVTITDAYGGSASAIETLGTGAVFMRWEPENNVISFGCYPTTGTSKRVQISQDWDLYIGSKSFKDLVEEAVASALYPAGRAILINANMSAPNPPYGREWRENGTIMINGTTYKCYEITLSTTAKSDEESGETSDETGDEA